jgi:hypothetical protein
VSPDRYRAKPRKKAAAVALPAAVRIRPSPKDAHQVVYFQRHKDDDSSESMPGRNFMNNCPAGVRAQMRAVLAAVAAAPPMRFSGGGYWEAMKGDMKGWFEVRVDGAQRHHFRLFCLLDYDAVNSEKPLLVVVAGLDKQFKTTLSDADYAGVRTLGDEFLARNPRSFA